jgi:hypothetical protein
MIDELLQKRRYVREFYKEADIPKELINSLLEKTWKVTPSKNNFMPYKVHVLGPEHEEYKEKVFFKCSHTEMQNSKAYDFMKEIFDKNPQNYANILSCSYLLIFTLRPEQNLNELQKFLKDIGHCDWSASDEKRINKVASVASLEVGLFADCFSALCLYHNIDVSFVGCFPKKISDWEDLPFITHSPLLIMPIGKGKKYRDEEDFVKKGFDPKPDYHRIINFI